MIFKNWDRIRKINLLIVSKLLRWFFATGFLLFFISFFVECETYRQVQVTSHNKNFAYLYNPVSSTFYAQYYVFSPSDIKTEIFIRIPRRELAFTTKNNEVVRKAFIAMQYKVKHLPENSFVVDSGSLILEIPDTNKLFVEFPLLIKTITYKHFFVTLDIKDISSGNKVSDFLTIDKTSPYNSQSFKVLGKDNNLLYDFQVHPESKIRVQYRNQEVKRFYVKYFSPSNRIAGVPFFSQNSNMSEFNEDTIFSINKDTLISIDKQGIYFIQADTLQEEGVSIFCFSKDFPAIKTPSAMLGPLRYLTSKKEFQQFSNYQNKKIAVDEFWLKAGGNIARGKELIKVFYNRVVLANIYFSSFKEGWMTDRGMIYIVFGPPKYVFRSPNAEKWIYGDIKNPQSLAFVFELVHNPFSTKHFILKRTDYYKNIWYQGVTTWRSGRAYVIGG